MKFYQKLVQETEAARNYLLTAPIIQRCMDGDITHEEYVLYLQQAYHHVKHTTPLLMATGSRIPFKDEWLRNAIAEYIEEELGHQEWILNDIENCGADKEETRNGDPLMSTEVMVAYSYNMIERVNPLGFFGLVHVLEGSSVNIAEKAADKIQQTLGLSNKCFSYLHSHGKLDQDHIKFFENLMNQIKNEEDQLAIIKAANVFYHLYGNMFREVGDAFTPKKNIAA